MKGRSILSIAALLVFFAAAAHGQTIARWDFEDDNLIVDEGSGTLARIGGGTVSFVTGNPGRAASSNNYPTAASPDPTNCWQINISTSSFFDIFLSFDEYRSSTGIRAFQVFYSIDGGTNYTAAAPATTVPDDSLWRSQTIDMSAISEIENAASVILQIRPYSAEATAGTWRLDDILISQGAPAATSTPTSPAATNTPTPTNTTGGPTSTPTNTPPSSSSIIINEVDSDTTGTDVAEFIELYDGGTGNTSLNGHVVVLFNGSVDTSYLAVDLDGYTTNAQGYFVIGSTGMGTPIEISPGSSGWLQNGADAVAVYLGHDTDFPLGTAVTTTNLVDALVYDTDDADDTGLLVLLNASEPQVNENINGLSAEESMQRCPNGTGGARNTSTYTLLSLTMGTANTCVIPPTNTPTIPASTPTPTNTSSGPTNTPTITPTNPPVSAIKINEVFINSVGTDIHCFVELYYPAGNLSLDGYSLVGVNGNGGVDYNTIDLTGQTIPADGFFVIAQDSGVTNNDLIATLVDFQNGPDSIQLRAGATVIDAMGYGDFTSAVFAGEGTPCPIISPEYSYSRIPDGEDLDDNVVDFFIGDLTAGLPNVEAVVPTATPTGSTPVPTNTPTSAGPTNTPTITPTSGPIPPIKINEIFVDPVSLDDDLEWMEIINTSDSPVDVTDVIIQSTTATGQVYTDRVILPSLVIPANGYLLVAESLVDVTSVPGTTVIYQPTSPGLDIDMQNGSSHTEGVRIVTGAHDVIDTVIYSNPNEPDLIPGDEPGDPYGEHFALRPLSGNSLARCPDGEDTNLCDEDFIRRITEYVTIGDMNNCEVPTPTPTPTGPTPTPPPTSAIKLNEVYVNPPGTDVGCFVELYFPGGMALTGYSIVGINGYDGSEYITIDLSTYSIPADGYFVIAQDTSVANYDVIDTRINLQNGPDSIQIKYSGVVVDAMGYGDFTGMIFGGEGDPAPAYFPGPYSHSRIPDGDDTEDNLTDFVAGELTSGLPNIETVIPTPTPPPQVPASSPAGLAVMIIMISVLIGWSLARSRN